MALDQLREEDPLRGCLEPIMRSTKRAASLTRQLLAFSRKQVLEPRLVELDVIVRDVEKMLRRLIGEDILLETRPDAAGTVMLADPGQLEQVLLNLAVNARDAMPRGGRLVTSTATEPGEGRGRLVLLFTDSGCGMTDEVKARIFEPFFTTKGPGKGTGLGLATVLGIVQQSGGTIEVESRTGNGTTFRMSFPVAEANGEAPATARPEPGAAVASGSRTVLLVEDEADVALLTTTILRGRGYRVLCAHGVSDAMLIARKNTGAVDLILTDVVMPEASGPEVVTRLRAMLGDVPALYMTGYMDDALLRHGVNSGQVAVIQKPFTAAALDETVRRVIDRRIPVGPPRV
jgi:CheY-like chemotaxis protein